MTDYVDPEEEKKQIKKKLRASVQAVAKASTNGCEIETRDPQLAVQVIEMAAEGNTRREICLQTGLSEKTVTKLLRSHREIITDMKGLLTSEAFNDLSAIRGKFRRRLDLSDDADLKKHRIDQIAKSLEIAHNNYAGMTGDIAGPKITIQTGPTLEDFIKYQTAMRARLQERKAGSIEV